MAIYNLGSVNIDHVYRVPHLPEPGETLAATSFNSGLGGKGANQSIAISRAGAQVFHIGAIGADGIWLADRMADAGVDTRFLSVIDVPTGHAIINVDDEAENVIVLFTGANRALTEDMVSKALGDAGAGDWLLLQNETNLGVYAAKAAKAKGMRVAYAAAPFDAEAAAAMLLVADLLAVNDIEAAQLSKALGVSTTDLPVAQVLITRGAEGATLQTGDEMISVDAFKVDPVDTTGAGDTFLGYFLAAIDLGKPAKDALTFASAASAIQVTKVGASVAIPDADAVVAFLNR
ncbi:ribokinase [Rhodobacterales bacterium 52_120_T64]|nr:ribokinase [Rhodobacterales bacterium 52_120_T64]